jgi:hypothetical protein
MQMPADQEKILVERDGSKLHGNPIMQRVFYSYLAHANVVMRLFAMTFTLIERPLVRSLLARR